MRLSAMDIRQQQFVVKLFRGFDPQEVDAFLEEVADDWEELLRENNLLKDQLATLEEQKKATDEQNQSLQQTLIIAQKMAEEFRESSKRAADIVLREAQLQAEKLLEESRQEQTRLSGEVNALKQQRRQVAEELLATLRMHQRLVEQKLADAP
ncbi:MAG TPA: DivIVA domain-containing protein [Methylomirabilota bacterium]|nr:DivIVA domain-containing protein [Methylomirabilota bacterium]